MDTLSPIDIITFYDEHPINRAEILSLASNSGLDIDNLTAADLWPWDQDHYGGLEAVDALAQAVQLHADTRLLDLCCGLGGPARYLASQYGCHVTGADLNQSRVDGATDLTARVGLSERLKFHCADACALPFADASFDTVISQEAFLHIDDREALLAECRRVLPRGGKLAFTDWIAGESLQPQHRSRFANTFSAARIVSTDEYNALLLSAGFGDIIVADLSAQWSQILRERLEMFRSLEAETVKRFGQQRHDTYLSNYEFFVERISRADLGGARVVARVTA